MELSQLVFFKEVVIEKGRRIGSFVEFFMWSLSFSIEKWLFAVYGGSSRGETRLKWSISQSARGK